MRNFLYYDRDENGRVLRVVSVTEDELREDYEMLHQIGMTPASSFEEFLDKMLLDEDFFKETYRGADHE